MLRKTYSKTGLICRVTFDIPPKINSKTASLCGEFNDWNYDHNPMKQRKDGRFSTTISLESGQTYRFKYLLDGERWENDLAADGYAVNNFGSDDSIVQV